MKQSQPTINSFLCIAFIAITIVNTATAMIEPVTIHYGIVNDCLILSWVQQHDNEFENVTQNHWSLPRQTIQQRHQAIVDAALTIPNISSIRTITCIQYTEQKSGARVEAYSVQKNTDESLESFFARCNNDHIYQKALQQKNHCPSFTTRLISAGYNRPLASILVIAVAAYSVHCFITRRKERKDHKTTV